jgi:hypothetical protein
LGIDKTLSNAFPTVGPPMTVNSNRDFAGFAVVCARQAQAHGARHDAWPHTHGAYGKPLPRIIHQPRRRASARVRSVQGRVRGVAIGRPEQRLVFDLPFRLVYRHGIEGGPEFEFGHVDAGRGELDAELIVRQPGEPHGLIGAIGRRHAVGV